MTDAEYLRKHCPPELPFAVRELVIANVIVGNYSAAFAADFMIALAARWRTPALSKEQ